jgi:hypothetical protein
MKEDGRSGDNPNEAAASRVVTAISTALRSLPSHHHSPIIIAWADGQGPCLSAKNNFGGIHEQAGDMN